MIAITLDMSIVALIAAIFFGVICALFHLVFCLFGNVAIKLLSSIIKSEVKLNRKILNNVYDGLFFLICGIGYILLMYAYLDGVISPYHMFFTVSTFCIFKKILFILVEKRH